MYLCFLRPVSQGNTKKNKNEEMGPNQTYKLSHSKGNHNNGKKPAEGDKIFTKDATDKGLTAKVYK